MKVVIVGGAGLIGSKVGKILADAGHDILVASRRNGIDTVTGEGLPKAVTGADVVIDVSNSPSFEDKEVLEFFTKSASNIAREAKNAGVKHVVALSIVGVDRLPGNGYFRAKVAQEEIVKNSGVPYTIVRATQFLEFLDTIAYGYTVGEEVRASTAYLQPIAADDVAKFIAEAAVASANDETIDVAGPEAFRTNVILKSHLSGKGDTRAVVADPEAGYFGAKLEQDSLIPVGGVPKLGDTTYETWAKTAV